MTWHGASRSLRGSHEESKRLSRHRCAAPPDCLDETAGSQVSPELPPELVEELGRILGETLVQEYQRDTSRIGVAPSGITGRAANEAGDE